MRARSLLAVVGVAAGLVGSRAEAQLAMPGEAGVVMGQVGLVVSDLDAQKEFWAELGGTPVQNGHLQMIEFPGAYVVLQQGQPTGGTVGSVINHIGFNVQDMQDWLPKWQAAGLKIAPMRRPTQAYLMGPDNIRVEILEDAAVARSLQFHHVHYFVVNPLETQAWYEQMLGAIPGKRGNFDAGDLPGVNLTFSRSDEPLIATKGRSLDRVGFEVKDLENFSKKLAAAGVTVERPYQRVGDPMLAAASFIDPWGTTIQLTENLSP